MSQALEGSLDTNVLLRFLLADDDKQFQSARRLIEQGPSPLRVSVLAIAEVVFVLEGKGFSRLEIKRNIDAICAHTQLYMTRATVIPALELYLKHPALSFMDAALAVDAEVEHAEPLYTFDKKLARQALQAKLAT